MAKKITNPYKSFMVAKLTSATRQSTHAVLLGIDDFGDNPATKHFIATDPTGSSWAAMGFTEVTPEGDYFRSLDGAGVLFAVQFNERILPGKVIQERVKKMADAFFERAGRSPNRKEFAEMREEAEQELLPTAFIRRSTVYAAVLPNDDLYVFTSSVRRFDDVTARLRSLLEALGHTVGLEEYSTDKMVNVLTSMALDSTDILTATDKGVFKGEDTETIRVKDKDIYSADVQSILARGYRAQELGMAMFDPLGDHAITFTLTKGLAFKGVKLSDTLLSGTFEDGADFHGISWMVAKEFSSLFNQVLKLIEDATGEEEEEL